MISMDNGLTGAGENIKNILEHLQRSGTFVTTPPRKKQTRGPPLSPLHENQRSAISEILGVAQTPAQHMSPRSTSHMHSQGVGGDTEVDDDETQGYDMDVVDLANEPHYIIPCTQKTQKMRGKENIVRGKAVVVLDSQSGGDDEETEMMGVAMEEYEIRRPQQPEIQEERRLRTTCKAQAGGRRLENAEIGEQNARTVQSPIYNVSEEESDDSDTIAELPRRRNAKKGGSLDGRHAARPAGSDGRPPNNGGRNTSQAQRSVGGHGSVPVARSTESNRRTKNPVGPRSPKGGRGVGVAATEVPHTSTTLPCERWDASGER
jgi:hypothetical protein